MSTITRTNGALGNKEENEQTSRGEQTQQGFESHGFTMHARNDVCCVLTAVLCPSFALECDVRIAAAYDVDGIAMPPVACVAGCAAAACAGVDAAFAVESLLRRRDATALPEGARRGGRVLIG